MDKIREEYMYVYNMHVPIEINRPKIEKRTEFLIRANPKQPSIHTLVMHCITQQL